jgi:hypothetical protein
MQAGGELLYLRKLLERKGFIQTTPASVFEDSTVCIEWGSNVIGGREHIYIRKRLAQEAIQNGEMRLVRVPTASQLADILTKRLHNQRWQACMQGILGKAFKPTQRTCFWSSRGGDRRGCRGLERLRSCGPMPPHALMRA